MTEGMSKVIAGAAVSVDGFIADRRDGVGPLFDWYFNGDAELVTGPGQYRPKGGYRPAARSAELLRQTWPRIGVAVIGRRLFDLTDGWGGRPAVGERVIVVTHRDPGDWPRRYPDAPFEFAGSLAEAVRRAQELAGRRDVAVNAGDLAGQAMLAGLVDRVEMAVAPVVFGSGVRFFGEHEVPMTMLANPSVVAGDRVTHLGYDVIKAA
jgi:dihydrofolate reductase